MSTTTSTAPKTKRERLLFGYKPYARNASFETVTDLMEQPLQLGTWLNHGLKYGRTIAFKDFHGTGKTSAIMEWLELHGLACVYLNAANMAPGDIVCIAPVRTADGEIQLRELTLANLQMDRPFVVYVDDMRQASQKVQNELLPLVCNGVIGMGRPENLAFVIMSDNEGAFEGIRTTEDGAMSDRMVTVKLEPNATGWRYALASKYKDVDLKPVFRVWDSLESDLRHILSPRCLDHVIYCALNGLPAILGLPILGDQRMRLVHSSTTSGGKPTTSDRTREVLEKICAGLKVAYREEGSVGDIVRTSLKLAMRDRLSILVQGPPGCGKTEITKAMVADAGMDNVYFSVAMTDPERLVVPMPDGNVIKAVLAEKLASKSPYVITWDEYNRPQSDATFSKLMESTQQWSIAGVPLEGCRAQVALCNPSEHNGRKMNVRKNNIAQADRFFISLQIQPGDIPAYDWLLEVWPTTVAPDAAGQARAKAVMATVIDWHKFDIDDAARSWISARALERLAELALSNLPLKNALPYLGEGEFAPVVLIDLELRLKDRPMTRLREIVADLDTWVTKLRSASETEREGTNDVDTVHDALTRAQVSELEEHIEAISSIVMLFPPKLKGTFFISSDKERQAFWLKCFQMAMKGKA